MGVFAVLAMGSTDGSPPAEANKLAGEPAAAPPKRWNTHYAHGTINVRSGPGQRYRVVGSLNRGDTLSLGEPDANGWARIMGTDSGYVFTRLDLVRTQRPTVVPSYAEAGACAEAMEAVHTRMNRRPDEVKTFEEAGLREVTWWYREKRRDRHPKHQFSFLTGPYTDGCKTSEIES